MSWLFLYIYLYIYETKNKKMKIIRVIDHSENYIEIMFEMSLSKNRMSEGIFFFLSYSIKNPVNQFSNPNFCVFQFIPFVNRDYTLGYPSNCRFTTTAFCLFDQKHLKWLYQFNIHNALQQQQWNDRIGVTVSGNFRSFIQHWAIHSHEFGAQWLTTTIQIEKHDNDKVEGNNWEQPYKRSFYKRTIKTNNQNKQTKHTKLNEMKDAFEEKIWMKTVVTMKAKKKTG